MVRTLNGSKPEAADNMEVYKAILRAYGSRFYQQEIINATKAVADSTFFIAPFLATPQLAQFFNDEMI